MRKCRRSKKAISTRGLETLFCAGSFTGGCAGMRCCQTSRPRRRAGIWSPTRSRAMRRSRSSPPRKRPKTARCSTRWAPWRGSGWSSRRRLKRTLPARAACSRRPGGRGAARSLPRASGNRRRTTGRRCRKPSISSCTRIPTRTTRSTAPALTAAAAAIGGRCGMSRCTLTTKSCARFCARRTAACAGR